MYANKMYVQWNKAVRNIWKLPYRTHTKLLPHIVHDLSIKDQMIARFVNYYASLLKSDNYVVKYFCLRSAYFANSTMGRNCAYISFLFNLNVLSMNHICCKMILSISWDKCLALQLYNVQIGNFMFTTGSFLC